MNASELSETERDRVLPPRFRSSAFRRYEAVLKQAIDLFPTEIEIDPAKFGLSTCTVEQRLRDAKTSQMEHKWNSTIDRLKFVQLADSLQVVSRNGKVYIGPKQAKKQTVEQVLGEAQHNSRLLKEPLAFDMPMANSYEVVCLLAANRALCRPLKLVIADSLADSLYSSFDINLEKQPDGSYILT